MAYALPLTCFVLTLFPRGFANSYAADINFLSIVGLPINDLQLSDSGSLSVDHFVTILNTQGKNSLSGN